LIDMQPPAYVTDALESRQLETLPSVLEVKRTLAGREKTFLCRLLAADERRAVVLWVAPEPMHVHGVDLPAGTVSFGHFWVDRPYNVYHWVSAEGRTVGFYFNISDGTRIEAERIEWRDLVIDVIALPDGRVDVLDEHELPAELPADVRARIDAGRAALLGDTPAVTAEIEAASRALAHLVFP
jgi:hypothetical protein